MKKTNATKTTTPVSLTSPSLGAIWEAFFVKPSPDFWSKCSEDEVAALQKRCESHWVTKASLLLRSLKFRGAVAGHTHYGWSVVLDIAAKLSPLHNTKDAHQHAMRMLKRSAGGTAYRDAVTSMGRELRLVDRDVLRGIDWVEQEALGRRMPPLRPPLWHEYYYRIVPRPRTPQGGSTGSQPTPP